MRYIFCLLSFVCVLCCHGCRTTKLPSSVPLLKDTLPTKPSVRLSPLEQASPSFTKTTDSLVVPPLSERMVDTIIQQNKLSCKYFTADVNVSYKDKDNRYSVDFFVILRMQKDSIIWLSVEAFGLELYRVLIDTKQIMIMDRFANKYRIIPAKEIDKLLGLKADLGLIQQILTGQFSPLQDTLSVYQQVKDTLRSVSYQKLYKHTIEYLISSMRKTKEIWEYTDYVEVPTFCTIQYDHYRTLEKNINFAHLRQIDIQGKVNMSVTLEYQKVKIDTKPSFPFTIPKNFSLAP